MGAEGKGGRGKRARGKRVAASIRVYRCPRGANFSRRYRKQDYTYSRCSRVFTTGFGASSRGWIASGEGGVRYLAHSRQMLTVPPL